MFHTSKRELILLDENSTITNIGNPTYLTSTFFYAVRRIKIFRLQEFLADSSANFNVVGGFLVEDQASRAIENR